MKKSIRTALLNLTAVSIALASPAVSTAEPKEWDIEAYDQCMASFKGKRSEQPGLWYQHLEKCCKESGGVWVATKCVAPPAEQPAEWTPEPEQIPPGVLEPLRPTGTP